MGTYVTEGVIGAALDSVGGRGNQVTSLAAIATLFNDAISKYGSGAYDNSPARVAALIGQCAQESAWFRTTTEYSAGSNRYSPYDGRTFIQVTWMDNYKSFGQWCVAKGLLDDPNYFASNPTALSDLKWAALGPVWYFATHGILPYADAQDWTAVGGIINTGSATGVPGGNATRVKACQAVYDYLVQNKISGGGTLVPSQTQLALAKQMVDWIGQFIYSQPNRYGAKEADCSSVVQRCYQTIAGIDPGSYTDAQAARGTSVFGVDLESVETALSLLMPGDLVLIKHYVPAGSAYWDHVEMYIGDGKICGHGGPGKGPQIHDFRAMWNSEKEIIARRYVESDTVTEDDMTTDQFNQIITLLKEISSQTLTTADSVTAGREGVKYDGELYAITKAILANQGHAIAATETTPAPVQTSPASTSDEVIRAQLQIARDALAAIEAQL